MNASPSTCPVPGCPNLVKPGRPLCPSHWGKSPIPLQKAVMIAAYYDSQKTGPAYQAALRALVTAVQSSSAGASSASGSDTSPAAAGPGGSGS